MYRIWYSSEEFKNFIVDHTILQNKEIECNKIYESDANNPKNFHTIPDHLKKILYLDCPDIIIEKDFEPILSIEDTKEAGTGHNAFQRFARLAASAENNVPCFYIYPEAKIITRKNANPTWDKINPLVFKTMERLMDIYMIPNLLFYYPSSFRQSKDNAQGADYFYDGGLSHNANHNYLACPNETDSEMIKMFKMIDQIIECTEREGVIPAKSKMINLKDFREHRDWMRMEYHQKNPNYIISSPLTNVIELPTTYLLNYLNKYENDSYRIGELLRSRKMTIIYQVDAQFRGDPYPGALAAIDYLKCRFGKSYEERDANLVLSWGKIIIDEENENFLLNSTKSTSIESFFEKVKSSEKKSLSNKNFKDLKNHEIPRYFMHSRYGTTYTKSKEIRIYSYFADAILFYDGTLWRDG